MQNSKKIFLILIPIILILGGLGYWYFSIQSSTTPQRTVGEVVRSGFQPFGNAPDGSGTQIPNNTITDTISATSTPNTPNAQVPVLRLLSDVPVGGYGASTTAGASIVRWIDRGRGNIYETRSDSLTTVTLSNTILPRTYASIWNKNLTALIGSFIEGNTSKVNTLYAEIKPNLSKTGKTSSTTPNADITPFELKGKNLPANMISYAASPKKDHIFMLINENGSGVGYTSTFTGSSVTRIFDTPLTQLNADWPEENTITLTTKGASGQGGFLYFVNPSTGTWKKILGPVNGLSTKTSRDGKYVAVSFTGSDGGIFLNIYSTANKEMIETSLYTLADKCIWGNFYKNVLYCGVPAQREKGSYPEDWYKGKISFTDSLWQVNASTKETTSLSSLIEDADRTIDAFNLQLDERDDFLFFMNKNDLSLWSLDLVSSN